MLALANLIVGGEAGESDLAYLDIERVLGGSGNDRIGGSAANNELYGNDANDTISAGDGSDTGGVDNLDDLLSVEILL